MYAFFLLCLFLPGFAAASDEHIPAAEVEFSVQAELAVGDLNDCFTLGSYGWIKPEHPPSRLRWKGRAAVNGYVDTPVGFRFVPVSNGWAVLRIGPRSDWDKSDRIEVDVRNVSVKGARVLSGKTTRMLQMTSGVPVVVRFTARSLVRSGYERMQRLPDSGTQAHDAVGYFQRGVNLGNRLESPPDEDWGAEYDSSDYDAIKSEGFDHVRIPCAWHYHTGSSPDFIINPGFFDQVDGMARPALERGLSVIINWHHFDAFTDNPMAHVEEFVRGWKQIAARYAQMEGRIAFELLNEPKDAADTLIMNDVYARVISAIRIEAPNNTIFIGPGRWNNAAELDRLILPHSESNIVVTIHDYEPFLFTHQGASWTAPITDTTNIVFPGPPDSHVYPAESLNVDAKWAVRWMEAYNVMPSEWNPSGSAALGYNLRLAAAWSEYYGRPVHVGEWGCIVITDAESRLRYYKEMIGILRETGLAWAIWDWKSHFRYWDHERQAPVTGMRQALFEGKH